MPWEWFNHPEYPQMPGPPTSTVIKDVRGLPVSEFDILVPHEMLRWAEEHVDQCMNNWKDDEDWKDAVFFEFFNDWFAVSLQEHHDLEEQVWNGYWINRGLAMPDSLKVDHKSIMEMLHDLCSYRGKCKGPEGAKNRAEFHAKWRVFREDIDYHLADEEVMYPGFAKQTNISEEDNAKKNMGIFVHMRPAAWPVLFPMMAHCMHLWMPHEAVAHALQNVPDTLKRQMDLYWLPKFFDQVLDRIDALQTNDRNSAVYKRWEATATQPWWEREGY